MKVCQTWNLNLGWEFDGFVRRWMIFYSIYCDLHNCVQCFSPPPFPGGAPRNIKEVNMRRGENGAGEWRGIVYFCGEPYSLMVFELCCWLFWMIGVYTHELLELIFVFFSYKVGGEMVSMFMVCWHTSEGAGEDEEEDDGGLGGWSWYDFWYPRIQMMVIKNSVWIFKTSREGYREKWGRMVRKGFSSEDTRKESGHLKPTFFKHPCWFFPFSSILPEEYQSVMLWPELIGTRGLLPFWHCQQLDDVLLEVIGKS